MSQDHPVERDIVASKDATFRKKKLFPLNGEPDATSLRASYLTPKDRFYVRHHGDIPRLAAGDYELEVSGLVGRDGRYGLDALRKEFDPVELVATLQCAGNRRRELDDIRDVDGIPWDEGALSTACWTGVRLADVLRAAGLPEDRDASSLHVAFLSADCIEKDGETLGFGGSIPLDKALSDEVLLAYKLNGEPLPLAHGAPLRVVVPGYLGARSVKWLTAVHILGEPSDNYFEQHAYKLFDPDVDKDEADWDEGRILGTLPVNAVTCSPVDGEAVRNPLKVEGYAMSGGGKKIRRVELSMDDGETWTDARIERQDNPWSWAFWSAELTLPPGEGRLELIARAWDSDAKTQPKNAEDLWNFKGYFNNAWHRVCLDRADG